MWKGALRHCVLQNFHHAAEDRHRAVCRRRNLAGTGLQVCGFVGWRCVHQIGVGKGELTCEPVGTGAEGAADPRLSGKKAAAQIKVDH